MPRDNTTSTINQLSIQLAKIGVEIVNISGDMADLKIAVGDIKKKMEADYATKEWCEGKYGQTTKTVNMILVAFGLAIVGAFAAFVINGGLK